MFKKYSFVFLFVFLSSTIIYAQSFFFSGFAGISNYRGDIGNKAFYLAHSHPAFGIGCLYEMNDRMLITVDFVNGKISGSDKFSPVNKNRNLSFYTNISEMSIGFEYILFDLYDYKVSPYAFVGVGRFRFNPFTKDKNGNEVNLSEQSTEGQGFYKDRKMYKLTQTAIPFGGGLQWSLSNDKRIGIMMGVRKTFTDYLDDVSTTYIDPIILAQKRGSTAVTLAYRGAEVNSSNPYPGDGAKRGNPDNKDWYFFSGVSFRARLKVSGRRAKNTREDKVSSKKSKVTCPSF